jgi:predicted lipase
MVTNVLNSPLRLYTYGQPRTGNGAYAEFVNNAVGVDNVYRSVHGRDALALFISPILTTTLNKLFS